MTTIVVVCGAGASSTFLAHRMNRVAGKAGLDFTTRAATLEDYPTRLRPGDVLLVGPQLAARFDEISGRAAQADAAAALLPGNVFGQDGADTALRLAAEAAAALGTDTRTGESGGTGAPTRGGNHG